MRKKIISMLIATSMVAAMVPSMMMTTVSAADVTDGLVAHYTFGDKAGTTVRNSISANGANGSWGTNPSEYYYGRGAATIKTDEAGADGGVLDTNNHRTTASADALRGVTDHTIQVYVKFREYRDWNQFINVGSNEHWVWDQTISRRNHIVCSLRGDNQGFGFETKVEDDNTQVDTRDTINSDQARAGYVNKWTLMTYSQEGSTAKLFVDGVLVSSGDAGSKTIAGLFDNIYSNGEDMEISLGNSLTWGDDGVNALIDDFRIYGRALSEAEITASKALYTENDIDGLPEGDLLYNFDFSQVEADGHTIKNKVAGNPDFKIWSGENTWTDGAMGDGALNFSQVYHPQVYADADNDVFKNMEDMSISTFVKFDTKGRQFFFEAAKLAAIETGAAGRNHARANNVLGLTTGDGRVKFEVVNFGQSRYIETTPEALSRGKYHLITFTLEGGAAKIYINSVLAKEGTFDPRGANAINMKNMNWAEQADQKFMFDIGGNTIWNDQPFYEQGLKGTMDDFRIYDRAITGTEVTDLYTEITKNVAASDLEEPWTEDVIHAWYPSMANRDRTKYNADGSITPVHSSHSMHNAFMGPKDPESIDLDATYYFKTYVRNGFTGAGDGEDGPSGGGYIEGYGDAVRFGNVLDGGAWRGNKWTAVTVPISGAELANINGGELNGQQFRLGYLANSDIEGEYPLNIYRTIYVSNTDTPLPEHPLNAVIDAISSDLPTGAVTIEDRADIEAVLNAYNALDARDQNSFAIKNLNALKTAETALEAVLPSVTSFKFAGVDGKITAPSGSQKGTITLTVPFGTSLTGTPVVTYSADAALKAPTSLENMDFAIPQDITVAASTAGTDVTYTVIVNVAPSPVCRITSFKFAGESAKITDPVGSANGKLEVVVPDNSTLKGNVEVVLAADAKLLSPSSLENVDLATAKDFVVMAANGDIATYTASAVKASAAVTAIKITGAKASLNVKKKLNLKVAVTPSTVKGATVKWKTSNKKLATVSGSGVVTAKKAGLVKITATVGRVSKTVNIKVKGHVTKVTMNKKKLTVKKGKAFNFVKAIKKINSPAKAYRISPKYKLTVNKKKLAKVSKTKIKALKKGTVKVTVKVNGKKVAAFKLKIK